MTKQTYVSISGITNYLNVSVSQSHGNAVAIATVTCETTSLSIGDAISIDMGYTTDHEVIFTGYVKQIERTVPEDTYVITAHDELVRAVDYFIAATNPDVVFTRYRIFAEDLVEDLLGLAGLTNFTAEATNFIYAWTIPAEINLVGCYEFCKQLGDMLVWNLWADKTGLVHFEERKPYVMGKDSSVVTITDDVIITITKTIDDDNLRNRVVCYGGAGIFAEAKATSPYLPSGFYKTAIVSSYVIDTQSSADVSVAYNLDTWNKLTTSLNTSIEGDTTIQARSVITVQQTDLGINSDWYVYGANHAIGPTGYTVQLDLRQ